MKTRPCTSKSGRFDCQIDPAIAASLREYCDRKHYRLGYVVSRAIANYLKVANHYHRSQGPLVEAPKAERCKTNLRPKPCALCDGANLECPQCGGVGVR